MNSLDYDFSKSGKRWVSYFDRLGFGNYSTEHDLINIFCETCSWLAIAMQEGQDFAKVELVWFSDTIIFYSTDDSRMSFQAVNGASTSFFDELLDAKIPVRGALAFGDFYADKANNLFLGKALVDACKYGEKFDWLGFVLHPSALKRMDEVSQPVSDLTYKRWDAKYKNRKTNAVEKEPNVVAYLVGPGSIMPMAGGNAYLDALEEMAACTDCERHKRKYLNTIEFLKHFSTPDSPATGTA
jgi:hypothetical protein